MPVLRSSPALPPGLTPTRLESLGGWGVGVEDPAQAEAAVVYGQWADRLFLTVACLFFVPGMADLGLWVASRSLSSLVGPASLLVLCSAYLYRRRRFRRHLERPAAPTAQAARRMGVR